MAYPVLRVHITSDFVKSFSKLSVSIQRLAAKKDKWFMSDAFDKRLDTHKLKGKLKGYLSYSVNRKYRIIFRFIGSNEVIYYDIGTHDIYK